MKSKELNPVLMTESDYKALKPFADSTYSTDVLSLARELDRAIIVHRYAFPHHAIRINSEVSLVEKKSKKTINFTIVMPQEADMKAKKISVLSPLSVAVIGFRQGEEVSCKLQGSNRHFLIDKVFNQ